ncbi:hypothetical protein GCM10028806_33860 [Spirosoma terrae]
MGNDTKTDSRSQEDTIQVECSTGRNNQITKLQVRVEGRMDPEAICRLLDEAKIQLLAAD